MKANTVNINVSRMQWPFEPSNIVALVMLMQWYGVQDTRLHEAARPHLSSEAARLLKVYAPVHLPDRVPGGGGSRGDTTREPGCQSALQMTSSSEEGK